MRDRRFTASTAVLMCLVLHAAGACGDDAGTGIPPKGEPRKPTLTIVSGDDQTGEVGTVLAQPLVVALRDTLGVPATGLFVRFFGNGVVADSALTDAAGLASVRWTLGRTSETQHVVAVGGVIVGSGLQFAEAVFTATATPGPAATIQTLAGVTIALPGEQIDTVFAFVRDRFGNPVPNAAVLWSVERGGGSVRALSDLTDASGIARAAFTLGASLGDNVVIATSAGLTDRLTVLGSNGLPASAIAVGGSHTCALSLIGEAYCWGSNLYAQLGASGSPVHTLPVRVTGSPRFTSLVAGGFHTCGLTSSGEAYCWGSNDAGALGLTGTSPAPPTRVAGNDTFTALAAGFTHTCGLTTGQTILCWGDNSAGQRGDGTDRSTPESYATIRRATPARIASDLSFVSIAASLYTTCAVATTGDTYCWGSNQLREFGNGVAGQCYIPGDFYYYEYYWPCSTAPVRVPLPAPPTSITAAAYSLCGVMPTGQLICWGNSVPSPVGVPGAVVSAAWSLGHIVCGLQNDDVSCWGFSGGTRPNDFQPARPFGDGAPLVNLSSNGTTSCGLSRESPPLAYCWGDNHAGQLGDGTFTVQRFPVRVGLPRPTR